MARYFFHLHDGDGVTRDEEGRELESRERVYKEALKGARSIVSYGAESGRIDLRGRIEVEDAMGEPVLVLRFSDAVQVTM